MRHVTYDPYVSSEQAEDVGAELVDLKTLMQISDFVCVSCPLNEETYHLINEERLLMMKKSAYFINVARGKIVDQKALTSVLEKKLIQGAGIDVFEQEPIDPNDPILSLDNVILSPHTLCMTDQCYRGIGESAVRSILEVADGKIPQHLIVNKEVLQNPDLTNKLNNYSTLKNN
jgi:D-3-phosphoglycerate dehydrogenase